METKSQRSDFLPERLRELRELRGYSLTEAAERLGISAAIFSQYENGRKVPGSETLAKIIEFFSISPLYLTKRRFEYPKLVAPINFRQFSSSTKKARLQAMQMEERMAFIAAYLDRFVELPRTNLPSIAGDFSTFSESDIEDAAAETRKLWGLGLGPIENLTNVLEANGIIVSTGELADRIDAFSSWRGSRPFIFLSNNQRSAVRNRFNAGHEIGHSILHTSVVKENLEKKESFERIEMQANRFASALLLPAETFAGELLSCSLSYLIELKKRWKVSLQAMVRRGRDLEIISDNQYTYIQRQLSMQGFRKKEPLDDILSLEQPSLLRGVFEMIVSEKIVSKGEILDHLLLPAQDLAGYANLPNDFFYSQDNLIKLNFRTKTRDPLF